LSERVSIGQRLLAGWMAIAVRFGFVQTVMLLVTFYFTLIGPVWIVTTIFRRDFLSKRGLRSAGSAWRDADPAAPDLERAKLLS
jgi:hypothetical protein